MKITIEPTPEIYDVPLKDGRMVPCRIWKGTTDSGIALEAYVMAVTPHGDDDSERFRREMPDFMRRARDVYDIDTGETDELF